MRKLDIGLDVDDVLLECTPYAVRLANEKYKMNPPLSVEEIKKWGGNGERGDVILEYFNDEEFYRTQPIIPGAKEFVQKLSKIANVYFVTAINPEFMSLRAMRLMEEFPEVPPQNIILTSSKSVVTLDVLLDDGPHNILQTIAKFPVLNRKPWNQNITGCLSINNYDDFFVILEAIQNSLKPTEPVDGNSIIALVGPSGSGKTAIAEKLCENNGYYKTTPYTTRSPRENEDKKAYHFISMDEFLEAKKNGEFFETTMYAGCGYGTKKEDLKALLEKGNVVIPIDITGAMTFKAHFKNVRTVFIKRDREKLLESLLERNVPNKDKVNRIISLETELRNQELCDFVIDNNKSIEYAANTIKSLLKNE